MDNILIKAKELLRNKNLVTIIGVIIVLGLLYWGYSSQINNAVVPVSVPVATTTIQPRTEITEDMVKTIEVPQITITNNVIKNKTFIVGKYSNVNSVIPEGSMFYTNTVIDKEKLPDSTFVKVKKGQIVYSFNVDLESTYGNAIMPGNKIDIYMKVGNGTTEKVMLGKLVENIEVLAVKDSSGKDVFENTDENRTPSMFIFGLREDIYLLLMKASYMSSLGVELFPVPHGGQVSTEGTTEVSTQQLADFIEAHSVNLPITKKEETDTLLPTFTNTNGKVTIKYPSKCTSKYKCSYTKDGGTAITVTKKKQTVTFTQTGKLTATVIEEDGTEHTANLDVTIDTSNSITDNSTTSNTNSAINNTQTTGQ